MNLKTQATYLIERGIANIRQQLKGYEQPQQKYAFETIRAIDWIFCEELFSTGTTAGKNHIAQRDLSSWGVNGALSRILPNELNDDPLVVFPSIPANQSRADHFLLQCGILNIAERQLELLKEDLLSAKVRRVNRKKTPSLGDHIIVLTSSSPSLYSETIGRRGQAWSSEQITIADRPRELELEQQHRLLLPQIRQHLFERDEPQKSAPAISRYFYDWAALYLRRMTQRDVVGEHETIGGRQFSEYVDVLTSLSAFSQERFCFAGLIKERQPELNYRNLLTGFSAWSDLVTNIAKLLDGDSSEISKILSYLTLEPSNFSTHLSKYEPAWAPLIRTNRDCCLLPTYGLDINPFAFLYNSLRALHEQDWFRIANNREERWIRELQTLFSGDRWKTTTRGIKIRRGNVTVTDIDFAIYDNRDNELAVFQLKWQQPTGSESRSRRSAARNLLDESNRWINSVNEWLADFGSAELANRLGFRTTQVPTVHLLVLARYTVHFSGFEVPPKKWSILMYNFCKEDHDGKKETYGGGDRREAAAG